MSTTATAVSPELNIDEKKANKIVKTNIALLIAGKLVSLLGSSIYSFAMSLYILQVTGSGLSFSLNLAISTVPRVVFGAVSGVVADRFDRKKLVVSLDILSGFIMMVLLAVGLIGELRLVYIYIATFLLSTCSTFFNTPLTASIPNIVDDKNLTRANSLSQSADSIATIAGPFIGGFIFALVNIHLFLLINGLSFIFSGISESFIDFNLRDKLCGKKEKTSDVPKERASDKLKKTFIVDLVDGVKYMISQKWLIVFGLFVVFFNLFIMIGLTVPIPYMANQVWGFTPQQYGILSMMFPAGMLLGSLILAQLPQAKSNYRRIMSCILTFSVMILLAGIVASDLIMLSNVQYLIVLTFLYLAMAVSSIFINVPVTVTMQKLVPNDKLGRVYGALGTLAIGLSPIGAVVAGALVDLVSPWILPFSCGVIMVVLTFFMSKIKEIKSL
ncbi:MFS transporter [Proteinivorax hydrogeniformans]|uniref:MFS transporter n=1 Tax=Proteinivorax hydrogeniformans TaxID=1826727 RepID=A0AAU8HUR9_9FIRM